jgi:2-polyprenyl-3-methyl-5-hydroxy-6-metoxy-1,4-benzoquinol methylase
MALAGDSNMSDTSPSRSQSLWVTIRETMMPDSDKSQLLGNTARRILREDPIYFATYAARYKFVSRMLSSTQNVVEVGCGDGFGSLLLAKAAKSVVCVDIDRDTLLDCQNRLVAFRNISFMYHDFVKSPKESLRGSADTLVSVDVLEHIDPKEEDGFMENTSSVLGRNGIAIFGTPNIEAFRFTSDISRAAHVNLKSQATLKDTLVKYYERVLLFGQNDEVLHTGFHGMSHYLWAIGFNPKRPS